MTKEDSKFIDSVVFEGMTSIRAIIKSNELGISDRRITKILYDEEKIAKIGKTIGYLTAVSKELGFSIEKTSANFLEEITLGTSHGGIVAITGPRTIPKLSDKTPLGNCGFFCMIQGIEDPYNFGYSLRSLYACGCNGIILPERNWMSAAGVVARSSAGASELFPVFSAAPEYAVNYFKTRGFRIVCAHEKTENTLGKTVLPLPLLLVVGGEKRGISKSIIDIADTLVKIDYAQSFNASLSAASATTMFAYEIMRQNAK